MKKIVIFASGAGSNAEKIIQHFNNSTLAHVVAVVTNNPNAKVLDRAKNNNVEGYIFTKTQLNSNEVLAFLREINPNLIVLAGFLLQFPENIINEFPNQILNIHPALLPKYGGKGMYGMNVHNAVLENKEKYSGITIHYVNENYDEGQIIFQEKIIVDDCATAQEIAERIHVLEHQHFPEVIERLIANEC